MRTKPLRSCTETGWYAGQKEDSGKDDEDTASVEVQ